MQQNRQGTAVDVVYRCRRRWEAVHTCYLYSAIRRLFDFQGWELASEASSLVGACLQPCTGLLVQMLPADRDDLST